MRTHTSWISRHICRRKETRKVLLWRFYESLPTSSFLPARAFSALGLAVLSRLGASVIPSSPEESAILRRFSVGEDTEELLRLLLPAGAYLCIERCRFLSLLLSGVRLLLGATGTGPAPRCSPIRLRLRLWRRSS